MVRATAGTPIVTDGPYAEAREYLPTPAAGGRGEETEGVAPAMTPLRTPGVRWTR
jgi:hypothetical protein